MAKNSHQTVSKPTPPAIGNLGASSAGRAEKQKQLRGEREVLKEHFGKRTREQADGFFQLADSPWGVACNQGPPEKVGFSCVSLQLTKGPPLLGVFFSESVSEMGHPPSQPDIELGFPTERGVPHPIHSSQAW